MPDDTPMATPPLSSRMVGDMAPLFAAKAAARLKFRPIQKDRHVVVQSDRGRYEFDYATLEEVLDATGRALAESELDLFHFLCDAPDGAREIHHILSHSSGAFLETVQCLPKERMTKDGPRELTPQEFGSAITYARRYSVQCLLGVSAEHDDDGNAASGNTVEDSKPRETRRQPPAPAPKAEPAKAAARPPSVPPPEGEMSDETVDRIKFLFRELGYRSLRGTEKILAVCGVERESMRASHGAILLATLESEFAAQRKAS